jgi:hypothetical protein
MQEEKQVAETVVRDEGIQTDSSDEHQADADSAKCGTFAPDSNGAGEFESVVQLPKRWSGIISTDGDYT